jgi:hypothetical protein
MRMPFSAAVYVHLPSRTVSWRRFIVALVTPSMDGTTPVCCSTLPREEVEIRTHGIIHLEHHVETQDTELEAWAETITNLEQQLLEF